MDLLLLLVDVLLFFKHVVLGFALGAVIMTAESVIMNAREEID